MCLGELAQVVETGPGRTALVRSSQRTSTVSLLALEDTLVAGDWVVCHSGFALSRVSADEAQEAASLRATFEPTTSERGAPAAATKQSTRKDAP